jgi:hypothetical protein
MAHPDTKHLATDSKLIQDSGRFLDKRHPQPPAKARSRRGATGKR